MKRYYLALDLKDDSELIAEYEAHHRNIWPEIKKSIRDADIEKMEIYRAGNRLVMMMEVNENFSFEKKEKMDLTNPKVQEWAALMWKYQQVIPVAEEGGKWVLMHKIFEL